MILALLFFLSGFAALILETVFQRQLSWLIGNAATATALVLAAFMGGLALGSLAFGRRADRSPSPLRLYAALELGAGASGAAVVWLLGSGRETLMVPLRAAAGGALRGAVELGLVFVLLLIPTMLIGGTLPAVARHAVRNPERLLGPLGLLYGINTAGGALGVLAAGFFLFERTGISTSGYLACGLDLLVGAAAWLVARSAAGEGDRAPADAARSAAPAAPGARRAVCLAAAAGGGGAILGCEVVWTRLLSLPMRSFSYSFSMMLGLFLLGLVGGALLLSALAGRIRRPLVTLGWVELALGLSVASSLLWLPYVLAPPRGSASFLEFVARSSLHALPVVLPPTVLSGIALPLTARCLAPAGGRVGADIGTVYAANTLGAIAGALLAGLWLLPRLGAGASLALLATVHGAVGALVLGYAGGRVRRVAACALAAACALSLGLPSERLVGSFLRASVGGERAGELLFYREAATDTVAVVGKDYGFQDPDAKSLITNGVAMAATVKPVWRYMAVEGHLPVLLARDPSRAVVIGLGTGITLAAVAAHHDVARIDAVELSEGVVGALPVFAGENDEAFRDERVRLVHDDGRHFLELSRERYGVITLEPPPPIVAGSAHLYSLDFYRICLRRLLPGGTVAQWLPLHAQSLASARMAAGTFVRAFPHVQLWLPSHRDAVLIGSDQPLRLELERVRRAYADPRTRSALERAYLETPEALLATYWTGRGGVEQWAALAPPVTDERPRMEFFRQQAGNMGDAEIGTLLVLPSPDWSWVAGLPAAAGLLDAVRREHEALRLYVRSEVDSDPAAAVAAARRARATEFLLYRLGCAADQRSRIERALAGAAPGPWRERQRRCEALLAAAPELVDPAP